MVLFPWNDKVTDIFFLYKVLTQLTHWLKLICFSILLVSASSTIDRILIQFIASGSGNETIKKLKWYLKFLKINLFVNCCRENVNENVILTNKTLIKYIFKFTQVFNSFYFFSGVLNVCFMFHPIHVRNDWRTFKKRRIMINLIYHRMVNY